MRHWSCCWPSLPPSAGWSSPHSSISLGRAGCVIPPPTHYTPTFTCTAHCAARTFRALPGSSAPRIPPLPAPPHAAAPPHARRCARLPGCPGARLPARQDAHPSARPPRTPPPPTTSVTSETPPADRYNVAPSPRTTPWRVALKHITRSSKRYQARIWAQIIRPTIGRDGARSPSLKTRNLRYLRPRGIPFCRIGVIPPCCALLDAPPYVCPGLFPLSLLGNCPASAHRPPSSTAFPPLLHAVPGWKRRNKDGEVGIQKKIRRKNNRGWRYGAGKGVSVMSREIYEKPGMVKL